MHDAFRAQHVSINKVWLVFSAKCSEREVTKKKSILIICKRACSVNSLRFLLSVCLSEMEMGVALL